MERMKMSQLSTHVAVVLVVGRGGEQQHAVVLTLDELLDVAIAQSLGVAQVVALVDDDEPVVSGMVDVDGLGIGDDGGLEVVSLDIVLPHLLQVGRTDDEGAARHVVFEDLGNASRSSGVWWQSSRRSPGRGRGRAGT